jgi:hypothetical protein
MQVGETFVEIPCLVGRLVVTTLESSSEIELQTGLETEGDVAEATERLRPGIDEKYRDGQHPALDSVDAGRLGLARRGDEFEAAAQRHWRRAVGDRDAFRFVAGLQWNRDRRLARDATPIDGVPLRLLRFSPRSSAASRAAGRKTASSSRGSVT